jgi:hypothetical protein
LEAIVPIVAPTHQSGRMDPVAGPLRATSHRGGEEVVELLLLGVVGQVVALRLLVIQLARTPDDPPLLRASRAPWQSRERRRRRHVLLTRAAVAGFVLASVVSAFGLVAVLRG